MATKINVRDLHDKLAAQDIPVVTVRLIAGRIELELANDATDEQKAAAQAIVDVYDQDAEDAAKASDQLTFEDINSAKNISDIKALMIKHFNLKG